jgi:hypothetical protein
MPASSQLADSGNLANICSMGDAGTPGGRFGRALKTGDPLIAITAAEETAQPDARRLARARDPAATCWRSPREPRFCARRCSLGPRAPPRRTRRARADRLGLRSAGARIVRSSFVYCSTVADCRPHESSLTARRLSGSRPLEVLVRAHDQDDRDDPEKREQGVDQNLDRQTAATEQPGDPERTEEATWCPPRTRTLASDVGGTSAPGRAQDA